MNSRKLPHYNGLHPMSIYRMIWWITAVILAASGGIAAAITVQTDILVSAVTAAVLIGGGSPWLRPITRRTTPPPRTLLPIALRDGATWAAGVVTVIGLITLAGAAALPLILLMAITSAPVHRYIGGRVEFTQALLCSPKSPLIRTSTVDVPLLPLPDCSQLSDEALCRCWRMSLPALQNGPSTSPSTTDALHLARTRATYLDEIERRDPRGSSPHEITHPHHISPDSTPLEMPMNQLRNLLMAGPVEND
eukprot:gene26217-31503_t